MESALACASATYRHADPAGPADPGARVGSDVAGARARPAAFAVFAGDDSLLGGDFDGADPRGRWLLEFARLGFTNRSEADHRAVDEDVLAGLPAVFRSLGDRWGEAAALSALATRALSRRPRRAAPQRRGRGAHVRGTG
ncbi:hypothetical protein ACFCXA_00720 [Streptomyces virginiae]|uniref:hypothetical protein n=1 Tax=Streptomyces virginiae TaxID=1961 RepID=UPI0035DC2FCA